MTYWTRLTPEWAHDFYRVPRAIASAPDNRFFGPEYNPFDSDGPWPLVAFLSVPDHPHLVALVIVTVQAEFIESDQYNPLTDTGGYVALTRTELDEFLMLLTKQAEELPPPTTAHGVPFRLLDETELPAFRLRPELLPGSKQYFYVQEDDPAQRDRPSNQDDEEIITLVEISLSRSLPCLRLFLGIARFPKESLRNDSFKPTEMGQPLIYLDRSDVAALVTLLQHYRRYVV